MVERSISVDELEKMLARNQMLDAIHNQRQLPAVSLFSLDWAGNPSAIGGTCAMYAVTNSKDSLAVVIPRHELDTSVRAILTPKEVN